MKKEIEILAPAGSYESMKAAVAAGADAVYIGGSRFGARAYADNLGEEQLLDAIDYVHLHGKKIYLTINTLLKENELQNELYSYLLPYYERGLDAVIVQDIGVLKFIKEQFPKLPIHASTQMTITGAAGAKFLETLGAERVVTARELQLHEIKEISEQTNVEIESFVHGALCYCYSGQCLYSSLLGGRSGNRGQCAQPCRLPYRVNGKEEPAYVLSLKDICTLEYIPELVEAGIYSFKIEGRMKKPEYVAIVTAMYRKYVDLYLESGKDSFRVDAKDREKLMDMYNRGGSHGGYYHTKNGREMISLERPNHAGVPALKVVKQNGKQVTAKAITDIHKGDVIEMPDREENYTFAESLKAGSNTTFLTHKKQQMKNGTILNRTRNEHLIQEIQNTILLKKMKEKINGKLMLSSTDSAKLKVSYSDIVVEVEGDTAQEALNQPMDAARIEKQMRKTGNTEFEFDKLEVQLCGKLFLPMQSLNVLRRNAIELLTEKILAKFRREKPERICFPKQKQISESKTELFYVSVAKLSQFDTVVTHPCVKRIYVDCNILTRIWENKDAARLIVQAHANKKEIFLAMPHIFRIDSYQSYETAYSFLFEEMAWDGILVRNYESVQFLKEHGYQGKMVTDHNLYQFNNYAKAFWLDQGVEHMTAPLELNFKELLQLGLTENELVVYGYLPMMVSAQCVRKTTSGCSKNSGQLIFKDRYQKSFCVKNHCDYCYNIIYNTAPLVLTDQKEEVQKLSPKALRIQFTTEDSAMIQYVMKLYEDVYVKNLERKDPDMEFTRGHFKRGIK